MMSNCTIAFCALALSFLSLDSSASHGAIYARPSAIADPNSSLEQIQFFPGWRGGPGWRGPWRGPPGWRGRPYWFARPWVRRPYYGTIVAGVALGTLVTVAALGAVPPRPAPNLCWYWADPDGRRGYWDYCS
jgi:hypothetical protein